MRNRIFLVGLLMLVTAGLLAGCGSGADAATVAAEEVPVVTEDDGQVVAEAVIEPAHWSELHFDAAGEVVEVQVAEGETVSAGDVLARLETDDLERAVSRAELDLRQAELRLECLEEPTEEADIREAEHRIDQAAAALTVAQMSHSTVRNSTLLNETQEDAQELYEEMLHRYEVRVEWYESGKESDYWFVDQAKEQLDDAKLNLDRIRQQGGVQSQDAYNEIVRAQQALQEAQDNLARLQEEPDKHDLEAARLDIAAAELALEETRHNLEDATLCAPVDGIVTKVDVEAGETATPGEVILVMATLDQLQARTVDLTELDVARIVEGQPVVVTVDALPELEFAGRVHEIALQPGDYRGDVVYAVTVELTDVADAPLRWGMTAMVEIEAD